MTTKLLRLASILEMLTALALIIAPSAVAWLILGDRVPGLGQSESSGGAFKNIWPDNPSLKSYLSEAIERGYQDGLDLMEKETPLNPKHIRMV